MDKRVVVYYNLKSTPDGYRMVKFDDLWFVESVYNIQYHRGRFYCDCPQGSKAPTCRHRDMVPTFCRHKAVDTGKFFCYDEDQWYPAIDMGL
jgi:hypothetical protein